MADHEMIPLSRCGFVSRGSDSELADFQEVFPLSDAGCGPGNHFFPAPAAEVSRRLLGLGVSVFLEKLWSFPFNVGDGEVHAIHVRQAKQSNLPEVSPEGNAVREPDRPIP